jgi:1-acyl-sn-glycerol-3-phosphate acyltransferase
MTHFLRALVFNLFFFGMTSVLCVAGLFVRLFAPRRSFQLARAWARLAVWGARQLCGIRVVVTGLEAVPPGPALIASQHQSAFDTLVWMTLLPAPSYVVKQELTRIPLFGPLLGASGMIPVDRNAGGAALRRLMRAARAARQAGRQLIIFPEGTRVAVGQRVTLQPGIAALAAHLDLPVFPVATDSGLRWGRRAFLKRPGIIHIAVGESLPAGMPRAELLAGIERHWRTMENQAFKPVDKAVDGLPAGAPPLGGQAVPVIHSYNETAGGTP